MKLFRTILFSAGILLLAQNAYSQLSVGVRGGVNITSFTGKEPFDPFPGYDAGLVLQYPLASFLTARAELLYVQQGTLLADYFLAGDMIERTGVRVAFHNAHVPVLLEFGIPALKESGVRPKLLFGGFYGYTIQAQEHYNTVIQLSGLGSVQYAGNSDFTSFIDQHQYGFVGALAFDVKMGGRYVSIETR